MDDYVSKPIRPERLVAALARAATHRRSRVGSVGHVDPTADLIAGAPDDNGPARRDTHTTSAGELTGQRGLDPAVLERLVETMGDHGFVMSLLDDLEHEATLALERLRTTTDLDAVRHDAHSLKSSSAQLGAVALSETARALEAAARAGDRSWVAELIGELGERLAGTVEAREHLDGW